AIISSNAPLSFVKDPEVIKLFNMIKPEYQLPSCKWISTNILDNIYENVQHGHESQILKIDNFSNQYHMGDNIYVIYKEIGISFGDKWIAFISDSGPDFKKAKHLIELVSSAMLKPQYPCITRWATFTKASKIILQVQRSLK
ncbi:2950_t:CDS:2, partial [Cetraspora pellucida]